MTVKQDLQAARDLITDPKHWTQKSSARNNDGIPVDPSDPSAVSFCVYGAMDHVMRDGIGVRYCAAIQALIKVYDMPVYYNDTHSHAEVLDLLDRVITSLPEGST